jgi:hypothetical protein
MIESRYSLTKIGKMPHFVLNVAYPGGTYRVRCPVKLDFSAGLDKPFPVVKNRSLVFVLPGGREVAAVNPWGSYLAERIALEQEVTEDVTQGT